MRELFFLSRNDAEVKERLFDVIYHSYWTFDSKKYFMLSLKFGNERDFYELLVASDQVQRAADISITIQFY